MIYAGPVFRFSFVNSAAVPPLTEGWFRSPRPRTTPVI
jgi:hypothetical protein